MTVVNRRRVALAAALLAAGAGGCAHGSKPRKAMPADQLYKFVRPKVVEFVFAADTKGVKDLRRYAGLKDADFNPDQGFCTGFFVANDVVMTAHHCVQGFVDVRTEYELKLHTGKRLKVSRVLGLDLKRDYALLEVKGAPDVGFLEFSKRTRIGQKVYTVGNVHGEGIAIREGLVSSIAPDPDNPSVDFVRFSAPASPGNSGGPLVDAFGDVMAVVIASEGKSENFNIGPLAKDLRAALERFAGDRKQKAVKLVADDHLYFRPPEQYLFLRVGLSGDWIEDDDARRRLENLRAEVKVPATVDGLVGQSARGINASALAARKAAAEIVKKKAKERNEPVEAEVSWTGVVSPRLPLFIPAQASRDFQTFELTADKKRLAHRFGIIGPPEVGDDAGAARLAAMMEAAGMGALAAALKERAKTAGAWALEPRFLGLRAERPQALKLPASDVFLTSVPRKMELPLEMLAMRPAIFARTRPEAPGGKWAAARAPSDAELLAALAGDGGLLFDTSHPLVRRKSMREFSMKKLDEKPARTTVKDEFGRTWTVLSWPMFDALTLESYCLPLPQGWTCTTMASPATDEPLVAVGRGNVLKFALAKLFVQPTFWAPDALAEFFKSGGAATDPLMRDFDVRPAAGGAWTVALRSLGVTFTTPAGPAPAAVKLTPGLTRRGNADQWVAVGFEALYLDGAAPRVCGAGVEVPGTDAVHLMHVERVRAARTSRDGKAAIPPARVYQKAVKSAAAPGHTAFGWCAPLAVSGTEAVARYEDLKAFPVAHN